MTGPGHQGGLQWRRLSAELVVISLGVFLGLAADAAWDTRQESLREIDYLLQLDEDLNVTESDLESATQRQQEIDSAATRAIEGISAASLPPSDSLAKWTATAFGASRFEPTMGTVLGLIQTGDMRLIRNRQLRGALLRYQQEAESYVNSGGRYLESRMRATEEVGRIMSLHALRSHAGVAPTRVSPDWNSAADNPAFHSAVSQLGTTSRNRSGFLLAMRESVQSVRQELDRELAARGVSPARP